MSKENSPRLGKGLEALIPRSLLAAGKTIMQLSVSLIVPNPYQPRLHFADEQLTSLAESIKQFGVNQPILVRRVGERHEIIAGERRFRASILAGLDQVPVIVKNVSDEDMLKLALVENLERADLNAIEIAKGYQRLIDEFSFTHQGIADLFSRSRSGVTNTLRLLNLPEPLQVAIHTGVLTEGHGRTLLPLTPESQTSLYAEAIEKNWSVRDLEQAVMRSKNKKIKKPAYVRFTELEKTLKQKIAVPVKIKGTHESGSISIRYGSQKEFETILGYFSGQ